MSLKLELTNLYINPDYYNPDYNFYNYHKFKQTGIINIIYKTPSIFLNGLYFEFPYAKLLDVKKATGSSTFQISLLLNSDDVLDASRSKKTVGYILNKIDTYNKSYFQTNAKKFEIRQSQTHKNNKYLAHYQPAVINTSMRHLSNTSNKHELSGDSTSIINIQELSNGSIPSAITLGSSRFNNPLIKKYEYNSFLTNPTSSTMIITVEIKHLYLYKICELIKANQLLLSSESEPANTCLTKFCNDTINFINQEFFDFKASEYSFNLEQNRINLAIKFWLKANSFERAKTFLVMPWKVCGYQI